MCLNFLRIYNFDNRNEKRKADDPTIEPGKKLRAVGDRRLRELAQEVRDTNLRPEAIHKASAQGHRKRKHPDAAYSAEMLVKDPSLGPKVKKFIKNPRPDPVKIPPDEMLSLVLRKNIPKDTFNEFASVVNGAVSESLGLKVCSIQS